MVASPSQLLERVDIDDAEANPFLAFLRSVGAAPFTEASVTAYKAEQVRRHTPVFWRRASVVSRVNELLINFALVTFGIVVVGVFAIPMLALINPSVLVNAVVLEFSSFIGLAGSIKLMFIIEHTGVYELAEWDRTNFRLHESHFGAPKEVTSLASMISHRFPKSIIDADRLIQNSRILDPFLVVTYDEKDYYIAVWDEPDFNNERTI